MEASVEYREGPYIGYRYYDTAGVAVRFPFGFGLSYTSFDYSDLSIDRAGASFTVRNSGEVAGMEVAQLYVGCPASRVYRPRKELKGFVKVFINAGESKRVRIEFDDKTFRYFNPFAGRWETEGAEYQILIGASCADIRLTGSIAVEGSDPAPYRPEDLPAYFSGSVRDVGLAEFERLLGRAVPEPRWDRDTPLGYNDTIAQCRYAKGAAARFAYRAIVAAHWVLWRIGKRGAANALMMSVYHMPFRWLERMTDGLVNRPMLDGILLMVNGHFFRGLGRLLSGRRNRDKR
jgi:beta-glucosidase